MPGDPRGGVPVIDLTADDDDSGWSSDTSYSSDDSGAGDPSQAGRAPRRVANAALRAGPSRTGADGPPPHGAGILSPRNERDSEGLIGVPAPQGRSREHEPIIINTLDDSSDDGIEYTGVSAPTTPPRRGVLPAGAGGPPRRGPSVRFASGLATAGARAGPSQAGAVEVGSSRPRGGRAITNHADFQRHLNDLNASIDRHRRNAEALVQEELEAEVHGVDDHLDRQIRSPPPHPAPRIGLGGAVYRGGNQQIHFGPAPGSRIRRLVLPEADENHPDAPDGFPRLRRLRNVPSRDGNDEHLPPDERMFRANQSLRNRLTNRLLGINGPAAGGDPALDVEGGEPGPATAAAAAAGPLLGQMAPPFFDYRAAFNRRLDFGFGGAAYGILNALGDLAGRAPPAESAQMITARVKPDDVPPPRSGFTHTWDAEELANAEAEQAKPGADKDMAISLSESGRVLPQKRKRARKPYLCCVACPEPLRVSGAVRDDEDRVWVLRCGHVLDQRCLARLSSQNEDAAATTAAMAAPKIEEHELDLPSPKRRRPAPRKAKSKTKAAVPPASLERIWRCPVATCGREHVTVEREGTWVQKEGVGALQIFV